MARRDTRVVAVRASVARLPNHSISAFDFGRIGASHRRALEGLKMLADAGVVRQISEGDYDRQFAADELFGLIEMFEGRLGGTIAAGER